MNKKQLATLAIGFTIGAATTFGFVTATDKEALGPQPATSTIDHNKQTSDRLKSLKNDEFDKAFLEEMIKHHQGAIDMAKLITINAKHDELKQLGQDIISAQSKEIDIMQTWQTDWGYKVVPKSHDM